MYSFSFLALLAASTAQAAAVGNGQTTNKLVFNGLPGSFTYQRASSLEVSGEWPNVNVNCPLETVEASGPIAPLTDEMHHIFRGPLNLKQFAVYQPSAASSKRDSIRESPMERRGRMAHLDKHKQKRGHAHNKHDAEKRAVGDWVTATIDGQVVSWVNEYSGQPTPAAQQANAAAAAAAASPATTTASAAVVPASVAASASPKSGSSGTVTTNSDLSSTSWTRVGYFDGASGHTENLLFTANNKWINGFGFAQGYVASDGMHNTASPQAISGFIPDNYEVIISSAQLCPATGGTAGCSVVAPGSDAAHGFGGDRIVVMEYTMPESTCTDCTNTVSGGGNYNTNQPAIWALSSNTVNIAQYGIGPNGACSGWASGAGEFDIHEILPGDEPKNIGYASFHMGDHYSGTPAQGFVRPTGPATQKLAYVLSGSYVGIHVLGSGFNMDEGLDAATVQALIAGQSSASKAGLSSLQVSNAGSPAYAADVASATFAAILAG